MISLIFESNYDCSNFAGYEIINSCNFVPDPVLFL